MRGEADNKVSVMETADGIDLIGDFDIVLTEIA